MAELQRPRMTGKSLPACLVLLSCFLGGTYAYSTGATNCASLPGIHAGSGAQQSGTDGAAIRFRVVGEAEDSFTYVPGEDHTVTLVAPVTPYLGFFVYALAFGTTPVGVWAAGDAGSAAKTVDCTPDSNVAITHTSASTKTSDLEFLWSAPNKDPVVFYAVVVMAGGDWYGNLPTGDIMLPISPRTPCHSFGDCSSCITIESHCSWCEEEEGKGTCYAKGSKTCAVREGCPGSCNGPPYFTGGCSADSIFKEDRCICSQSHTQHCSQSFGYCGNRLGDCFSMTSSEGQAGCSLGGTFNPSVGDCPCLETNMTCTSGPGLAGVCQRQGAVHLAYTKSMDSDFPAVFDKGYFFFPPDSLHYFTTHPVEFGDELYGVDAEPVLIQSVVTTNGSALISGLATVYSDVILEKIALYTDNITFMGGDLILQGHLSGGVWVKELTHIKNSVALRPFQGPIERATTPDIYYLQTGGEFIVEAGLIVSSNLSHIFQQTTIYAGSPIRFHTELLALITSTVNVPSSEFLLVTTVTNTQGPDPLFATVSINMTTFPQTGQVDIFDSQTIMSGSMFNGRVKMDTSLVNPDTAQTGGGQGKRRQAKVLSGGGPVPLYGFPSWILAYNTQFNAGIVFRSTAIYLMDILTTVTGEFRCEGGLIYFSRLWDGVVMTVGGGGDITFRSCQIELDYTELYDESSGDDSFPHLPGSVITIMETAGSIAGLPLVRLPAESNSFDGYLRAFVEDTGSVRQLRVMVEDNSFLSTPTSQGQSRLYSLDYMANTGWSPNFDSAIAELPFSMGWNEAYDGDPVVPYPSGVSDYNSNVVEVETLATHSSLNFFRVHFYYDLPNTIRAYVEDNIELLFSRNDSIPINFLEKAGIDADVVRISTLSVRALELSCGRNAEYEAWVCEDEFYIYNPNCEPGMLPAGQCGTTFTSQLQDPSCVPSAPYCHVVRGP